MALTIVASGVSAPQSGTINSIKAGFAATSGWIITAGQVVSIDPTTGYLVPAMAASGFNYSGVAGIALNNAYNGQPISYCTKGLMALGVTGAGSGLVVGQQYALDSVTSGGIIPDSALVSGAYVVQLGYCSVSGFINLNIINTGVQLQ
jgi:hypothetical protein